MATKILVKPAEDYFVAFLATRGINITLERAEVIHYLGTSKKELTKLVKENDPDLVVIHDKSVFDLDYRFPFVLDEVKNDRDIYVPRTVITNAPELAKLHYQSLGLERVIHNCNEGKEIEAREKLKINANTVKKVFAAMMWE